MFFFSGGIEIDRNKMYVFNFLTRIKSKLVLNLNLKGGRKE